jgi:hypothetical protein
MSDGMTDWSVIVFFLIVLIGLRSKGDTIEAKDPESYRGIVFGLAILSLMCLARVYRGVGLLDGIPFVSEPLFFDLLYWIGVISGSMLMIAGVGNWLPRAREIRRYNRRRVRYLELLLKVEQLMGVQTGLDATLVSAAGLMLRQLNLESGAVFKRSCSSAEWHLVGTAGDPPSVGPNSVLSVPESSDNAIRPGLRLPVVIDGQQVGCFVFWSRAGQELSADLQRAARRAVEIVARRIDLDRARLRVEADRGFARFRRSLDREMAHIDSSPKRFSLFVNRLSRHVRFDWISLTLWREGARSGCRFSGNREGRILVQNDAPLPGRTCLSGPAFHAARTVFYGDLASNKRPGHEEILSDGEVRTLLAMPVGLSPGYRLVLTLACNNAGALRPRDRSHIENLAASIGAVVWPEIVRPEVSRNSELDIPLPVAVRSRAATLPPGSSADFGRFTHRRELVAR